MQAFSAQQTTSWDEPFWINDFPGMRAERFNELLKSFPRQNLTRVFFPERIKPESSSHYGYGYTAAWKDRARNLYANTTSLFSPPQLNKLNLIFKRMDTDFQPPHLDKLMRTVYFVIIKPNHLPNECMADPALLTTMIKYIVDRKTSNQVKIELLSDVWTNVVEELVKHYEKNISLADLFLSELAMLTDFVEIIVPLIMQHQTLKAFLFAPLIKEDTRFENIVLRRLTLQNINLVESIDKNTLKKMLIVSDENNQCPGLFEWAAAHGNRSTYFMLWMRAVKPHIGTPSEPEVIRAFINGLYMARNRKYIKEQDFYSILAYLAQASNDFKVALLSRDFTPFESHKIPLLIKLDLPINETVELLNEFWEKISQSDIDQTRSFHQFLFEARTLTKNFDVISALAQANLGFLNSILSEDFFGTVMGSHHDLREIDDVGTEDTGEKIEIIRHYLKLLPDNEGSIFHIKMLLINSFMVNGIRYTLESMDSSQQNTSQTLLDFLTELHPMIKDYPSGKEKVLQTLNHYFLLRNKTPHHLSRLLNAFGRDRALSWFLLAYAFEIPRDNVQNIYKQYNFLVKFYSLKQSVSYFCDDAEHIQIHYSKAGQSLIALLNELSINKVEYLQGKPILQYGETFGVAPLVAPWFDAGGVLYVEPASQRRISNGIGLIDPETRKEHEQCGPNPFSPPCENGEQFLPSAPMKQTVDAYTDNFNEDVDSVIVTELRPTGSRKSLVNARGSESSGEMMTDAECYVVADARIISEGDGSQITGKVQAEPVRAPGSVKQNVYSAPGSRVLTFPAVPNHRLREQETSNQQEDIPNGKMGIAPA